MNSRPIYLDYMATTPIDPRVAAKMMLFLGPEGSFGNPASLTHSYGTEAALAVEHAREQIAATVNARPDELIFTSGATEANNLALFGAARFYKNKGKHLITMRTEHKAVLDCFVQLEKEGFSVTYLSPDNDGLLPIHRLEQALKEDTILVSIMQVNNETGVIQDIGSIGALLRGKGILFHVDAAQSAGKLSIDLNTLPVHLMSFSAHKNYGPKGIGALYLRKKPRVRIQPLILGGGHEHGLRSGTLATHQIVGMGEAFAIAESERIEEQRRLLRYRERLWAGIKSLPRITLNGHEHQRIAGNLNITFAGLNGDSLLYALHELALSTSSACTSASIQPSYVLKELGLSDELAQSSLRLSLGRFTQEEDIEKAISTIRTQVQYLQTLAP